MAIYVIYLKLILAIFLLYKLVKLTLSNHKEKNTLLIFVITYIVIVDVRSLLLKTTSENTISELAVLLFLIYFFIRVIGESSKTTSIMRSFIDLKALFDSEIIDKLEEGVALIKSESLEVITSNFAFKNLIGDGTSFVKLPDVVSAVSRGEDHLEIVNFENEKRIIRIRLIQYGKKFAILYIKDISDRERITHQYKQMNQEMMKLWENAPHLVLMRDEDGMITFVNEAMANFLHKSKQNLIGKHYKAIYNLERDFDWHVQVNQKLIHGDLTVIKAVMSYTYQLGALGFMNLEEQIFMIDGEKQIITNGVDLTQTYYLDLLQKAFVSIHGRPEQQQHKTYVVIDLFHQDILFKEQLTSHVVPSLSMFISELDDESKAYLQDLISGKTAFSEKILTYKKFYNFYAEQCFFAPNGTLVGILLKYLNPEVAVFNQALMGSMIMNHVKEGILVVNAAGGIEYHNEMIERILNYSSAELSQLNIKDITLGLTDDVFSRNMDLIKQHSSLHFERIYLTKDRQEVPTEVIAMHFEQDLESMMLLLVRDISEKFIYKKRLVDSQSRYAQIFESLQDGVLEIRLPEKSVSIFREFDKEKGFVGMEINFLQWLNNVSDQDRSEVYEAIDIITSEKKQNHVFEYRYFKKSGWEWYRANGKYIESDEGASIVIINQNISEIKTISQKLDESQTIINESERIANMSHWKFMIPKNMFIVSKSFSEMIHSKLELGELYYESFLEMVYPVDLSYFVYKFEKFLWNHEHLDIIFRCHNHGKVIYVNMVGQVYFDDEKIPVYAIGSFSDITEKMQSKQQFEESKNLLEKVIEHMPIGLIVLKANGTVEKISQTLMNLLRLKDIDDLNIKLLSARFKEMFNEFDETAFESLIQHPSKVKDHHMALSINPDCLSKENTSKDNASLEIMQMLISPIVDSDHQYIGTSISFLKDQIKD